MIKFKKFDISDISLVLKWFKKDYIKDIWVSIANKSDKELINKYKKRLNEAVIEMFIIQKNNLNIGYIQTYILDDTVPFMIEGLSKGIDLFIGEEDYLNKGLGTKIITKFIKDHVFNDSSVIYACIDPEVRNKRAIRCYEKVGFKFVNEAYCNHSKLLTHYMILDRNWFFTQKEAIEYAKELEKTGASYVIHKSDGTKRKKKY